MLSHQYCLEKIATVERMVSLNQKLGGDPPPALKELIEKLLHCGHADIEARAKHLYSQLPKTKRFWQFWK